MTDENIEETVEETTEQVQKKAPSRPKGSSRAKRHSRPERIPVTGHRDILTVRGKDPNFHYRFVLDVDENGARIFRFKQAGFEFVNADEIDGVGTARVASDSGVGTIVRIPAGNHAKTGTPQYLYLMKQPMEWYEEDQAAKEEDIARRERDLTEMFQGDDGHYGNIRIRS